MRISVPEEVMDVEVNADWGQEIFLDGLAEYVRLFVKRALEAAIRNELTEFLGFERYTRKIIATATTIGT